MENSSGKFWLRKRFWTFVIAAAAMVAVLADIDVGQAVGLAQSGLEEWAAAVAVLAQFYAGAVAKIRMTLPGKGG